MERLSISFIVLFLGVFVSFLAYLVIGRIIRPLIKKILRNKTPNLVDIIDGVIKLVAILASLFIFLLFISYIVDPIDIKKSLGENMRTIISSVFVIILILIVTFVILQIIRNVFRQLRYRYMEIFSAFFQVIIIFATILTILEYIGIKATPFIEIFRVIIYTIGLTIALSLGISIGLSIKDKIEQFLFNEKAKNPKTRKNKKIDSNGLSL